MTVHSLYYVQLGLFESITFLLLLGAASTSLAQLFIPAVQRQPHHLPILRMVAFTDILQILHQVDPYAVFGIYSTALAHMFQVQVTSMLFYACAFSLEYNFESLYNLMPQNRPWYIRPLLWIVPILHHLIRTVATCFEFTIDLNTASASFLSIFVTIRSTTSIAVCGCLSFFSLMLVAKLGLTIRNFIRKLEHLQKREIDALAAAKSAGISQPNPSDTVTNLSAVERLDSLPVKLPNNSMVISGIQSRIAAMRLALRQVVLGALGINVLLITTFALNATRLDDIAHNRLSRDEYVVTDPSVWIWKGVTVHGQHMVALTLFTWYTWRSPMLWLRSPYSFMSTMSFGLEFAAAQAARAARVARDPLTPSTDEFRQAKGVQALAIDSATPRSSSQGHPGPFLQSPRTANEDKIMIVCTSPRTNNDEDPHAHVRDLICPGTVQSTTRQIPVPPYNSTVEETIHVKHDSQLPPIYEQHRNNTDLEHGPPVEYPAGILIGESKLVVNREGDHARIDISTSQQLEQVN